MMANPSPHVRELPSARGLDVWAQVGDMNTGDPEVRRHVPWPFPGNIFPETLGALQLDEDLLREGS
jgi:hypothetical protein